MKRLAFAAVFVVAMLSACSSSGGATPAESSGAGSASAASASATLDIQNMCDVLTAGDVSSWLGRSITATRLAMSDPTCVYRPDGDRLGVPSLTASLESISYDQLWQQIASTYTISDEQQITVTASTRSADRAVFATGQTKTATPQPYAVLLAEFQGQVIHLALVGEQSPSVAKSTLTQSAGKVLES